MTPNAETRRVLLASASPRRQELLAMAGFVVVVFPPQVDEAREPGEELAVMVERLARAKAADVRRRCGAEFASLPCVAADTMVALDGTSIGKPRDAAHAAEILRVLRARPHDVLTGFCVLRGARARSGVVRSRVWMRDASAQAIAAYVATGEPLDKAGAYGIQGAGAAFVQRVDGSFTNVVGLPLEEVIAAIAEVSG
ncbi:MAG: Maf family protein [Planctomycetota bacterium]